MGVAAVEVVRSGNFSDIQESGVEGDFRRIFVLNN